MEFLYGLLTAVAFFIALLGFYFIGYKAGKRTHTPKPLSEADESEKYKLEQFNKGFKEMFAYDVDKALQRKKVTQ